MKASEETRRLRVALSAHQLESIHAALIREGDEREHGAFLFAKPQREDLLEVVEVRMLAADHFASQGIGYLELRDGALQDVILRAHQRKMALIEAHSHPFSTGRWVAFSPFDEDGLSEVAPHVAWRLSGRPYVALVFGQHAFDGLYWSVPSRSPSGAVDLVVDGRVHRASGESLHRWGGG